MGAASPNVLSYPTQTPPRCLTNKRVSIPAWVFTRSVRSLPSAVGASIRVEVTPPHSAVVVATVDVSSLGYVPADSSMAGCRRLLMPIHTWRRQTRSASHYPRPAPKRPSFRGEDVLLMDNHVRGADAWCILNCFSLSLSLLHQPQTAVFSRDCQLQTAAATTLSHSRGEGVKREKVMQHMQAKMT